MIDPRRLLVLRALADHGTVRAAAEKLYLTPSAVSQQLTVLENEVGQPLLVRQGRRVRLTAAGELLVEHAKAVLAELERAEASLAACAEGTVGTVGVASFASAITQVVAPSIVALRQRAPDVRVLVRDAEGHNSLMMLLAGEIDIAISMEYTSMLQADARRVSRFPLYAEPFDVVLPPDHRLGAAAEVAIDELRDEDWIAPLPGNPCRAVAQVCCENAGFVPTITHTSDDFHAVVALVAAGTGVALVPRTAITRSEGVVALPVAGKPPTRRVFAAVQRGREDHPLVRVVLDALLASKECGAIWPL
ncbi:LysR family transcriptional regulator [Saccharopolyspora phatthalungensis]|uniref:DNA-binding transcriptional LysR family regulator n=1 Tax=Saccharopolyspora phatthalungensis TaxID=664693 RepID=A0A840Q5R6_9PSEU|nr:LysR family transcriptional regulator [Saccharopolyspora phatthalungensis]MBB5155220.1 DNA-binding transcriptional LysR family regulator [Saccharopolyspora phatthalungensis]